MNENLDNNQSERKNTQPDYHDRRAARRLRIAERQAGRSGSWVAGAVLILAGIFIMLQNLNLFELTNWWALFILIPAAGAFGNAWRSYQNDQKISAPARASLISGIILTMVSAMFLFELNWTILGPVLLILAGAGILANTLLPSNQEDHP